MTLDTLMNMPADDLEKITTAELEKHFEPYLNVTRPERQVSTDGKVRRQHTVDTKPTVAQKNPEGYNKARQYMLDNMGIDLDDV
jgi:hypothetical protein